MPLDVYDRAIASGLSHDEAILAEFNAGLRVNKSDLEMLSRTGLVDFDFSEAQKTMLSAPRESLQPGNYHVTPINRATTTIIEAVPSVVSPKLGVAAPLGLYNDSGTFSAVSTYTPQLPVIGGISTVSALLLKLLRLAGSASGTTSLLGKQTSLVSRVLTVLGLTQIADLFFDLPIGDDVARDWEGFLKTIDRMEQEGIIYPWTAKHRRGLHAGEPIAPRYLIFDLDKERGFYSTFHMSRAGLTAHDDKQDTLKRPRRARRVRSRR